VAELGRIRSIRSNPDAALARRGLGVVQTTWGGFASFATAYAAQSAGAAPEKNSASESARCFQELFKAMREP
jgi:hypothetical protein